MTRKRFIKLCMADGESRNEARVTANFVLMANDIAKRQNEYWKSYGDTYRMPYESYEIMARLYGLIGGNE